MTDIVANAQTEVTFDYLRSLLDKELTFIEPNYYCTIRGLSRLLSIQAASLCDSRLQKNGVPRGTLKRLTMCSPENLPESLKPVAGFDYTIISPNAKANFKANKDTSLIPEVVAASIIKYYAYDARTVLQRAKQLDLLMTTVGIRNFFQQISTGNNQVEQKAEIVKPQHAKPLPGVLPEVEDILVNETPADKLLRLFQKLESARLTTTQINNFIRHNLLVDDETVNTSYRGVQKHKNRYRAYISVNGVPKMIGSYESAEDAAHAYDAYAVIVHGEKARLNF